jgi:hypothetical protein
MTRYLQIASRLALFALAACGAVPPADETADDALPETQLSKADALLKAPYGSWAPAQPKSGELSLLRFHFNGSIDNEDGRYEYEIKDGAPAFGFFRITRAGSTNFIRFLEKDAATLVDRYAVRKKGDSIQLRKAGSSKWQSLQPRATTGADLAGKSYVEALEGQGLLCDFSPLKSISFISADRFEGVTDDCSVIIDAGTGDADDDTTETVPGGKQVSGSFTIQSEKDTIVGGTFDHAFFTADDGTKFDHTLSITKVVKVENDKGVFVDGIELTSNEMILQ